jgi:peptidoglycan/LPS O-acetylase OafA/YrhL
LSIIHCQLQHQDLHFPSSSKFHGLDHLRTVAITFVFLFHYKLSMFGHPQWLEDVAKFGWTGVDLFFVLSGFLISSQLFLAIKQGQSVHLKEFFLKRAFRILPAYLVVVAIYFCFPGFHEREALPSVWRFLTFTQNIGLNIQTSGTFSHAWSLCVEEHFYLVFPLIVFTFQYLNRLKYAALLLAVLFCIGLVLRMFAFDTLYLPHVADEDAWRYWYQHIYYPTYTRMDGLLVGVAVAALFHFAPHVWHAISKFGNLLLVGGLALLTLAYHVCFDTQSYVASIYGFPLIAIGYGLLVMGAISPTSLLFQWKSRVTTYIATTSYAIYLTHKGIVHITQEVATSYGLDIDSNLVLLLCAFTCMVGASLLHFVIEKPFMMLRQRFVGVAK